MIGKIAAIVGAAGMAVAAGGAALAADVTPPPSGSVFYSPTPMVTAHVEMGMAVVGGGSGSGNGTTYGLFTAAGRANKVLWHGWNLELEAGGAGTVATGNNGTSVFGGYAHLWTMATPTTAVGVFGGSAFTGGQSVPTVGVEGKVHLGPLDLTASAADNFPSGGASFWVGSAAANYYLNPNLRIGAGATFVGNPGSGVGNTYIITADAEKRFKDPISIWGSVNYVGNTGGNGNVWAAIAGLRIFADAPNGTLRSHDDLVPWHYTDPLRTY